MERLWIASKRSLAPQPDAHLTRTPSTIALGAPNRDISATRRTASFCGSLAGCHPTGFSKGKQTDATPERAHCMLIRLTPDA